MSAERDRLTHLDGLRALAVLGVVVFHSSVRQDLPISVLLFQGCHGVELFFVVSGFCLAYPTLERLRSGTVFEFDSIGFFAKRLVRIFPPYLAALGVLIALAFIPGWQHALVDAKVAEAGLSPLDALREAFLLDGGPLHNASFWTLAVELRWYAVFPLALFLFVRYPRALALLGIALWVLHYQSSAHVMDTLTLPAFFLGILAADAHIARPRWLRFAPYAFVGAFTLAILLEPASRFPIWQVVAFTLVLWASWSDPFQRLLRWRPLAFIGVSSYSIYLIHQPVIAWSRSWGAVPAVAGIIGVAAGIALWALVERTLLLDAFRAPMVEATRHVIERLVRVHRGTRTTQPPVAAMTPIRAQLTNLSSSRTPTGAL